MNEPASIPAKANIFAAGVVLWRRTSDRKSLEVAVVHRPRYDDWSFPKGKIDPGEVAPVTAVREVLEETGMHCRLGRHLARITYPVPGHRKLKRVDYWVGTPTGGKFESNREVDQMLWRPASRVMDELSYPVDRRVLRSFMHMAPETKTLLLVRHGMAGRRARYAGPDIERPLDKLGRAQAHALVDVLRSFGATHVHSAEPTRCVETVSPLATKLGVKITLEPSLSETAYAEDREAAQKRITKLAAKSGVRAVCSQGKVIPDLLTWWADRDGVTLPASRNRKGSVWVLSLQNDRLVAADHLSSPIARD